MKNLAKIFTAIVVAFAAYSCVADATEDLGVKVGNGEGQTTLTLSLEDSRVQLGEKADGVYPLYWSEGDAIAVNGSASTALTSEQAGVSTAKFSFAEEISYPYNIVYPAPAAGVAAVTKNCYPVVFPATQQYVAGNIDPKAMPMYGYTEKGVPTLSHLVGVIRLAVAGSNGEVVKSLTVTAEKEAISGTYDVDCATGALTAQAGKTSQKVTMSFGEGLALSAKATPIYVAVPAGQYGVLMFTLQTESHEKMTVKFNSDVNPIETGTVREFAEFVYEANTADADSVFIIDSEDALVEFAATAAEFYPYTKAKVTANLDMSGYDWTPIEGFGAYTFDGGNYTIKGLSAPLFGSTAATIQNVKLTNIAFEETERTHMGAIACHLYGIMDNCSASGTININNTTTETTVANYAGINHGGLVGTAHGALVQNCTNNIDITITSLVKEGTSCASTVGGVVGGATDGCKIGGLTNNGDITYVGTTHSGNMYISGVVGKNSDVNGQADFLAFSNCTNNGAISTAKGSISAGDILLSGITGRLEITPGTVCDKLVNTGVITHNGECANFRGAGIVSYYARVSFTNCSNSGDITVTTGAKATSAYLAGIAAATVHTDKVDNCSNSGDLYIGDGLEFTSAVQLCGIICTVYNNPDLTEQAVVANCSNSGSLYCGNSSNTNSANAGRLYLAPLFGAAHEVAMSNCVNEATGTMTAKTGAWASRYMIGGVAAYIGVNNANCANTTITDCENKGAIIVEPVGDVHSAQIGGVTSEPYYNQKTDAHWVKYLRVKNSGDITVKGTFTAGGHPFLGGFMGINNHDNVEMKDCENSGDITFAATAASARVGGLVGDDDNNRYFLMDGCVNKGNIAYNCVATTVVRTGGVVGHRQVGTTTEIKNTVNEGNITVADQTVTSTELHPYNIAGVVGYNNGTNLTITNCTNGSAKDSTKGAITVGDAPSGIGLAGMVGISAQALTITGCKNYGAIQQTGVGSCNSTYRAHIAGILGECLVGGINITNCENYGLVEYGTADNASGARIDVAGIVATTLSTGNVISGCKNSGTVSYKAVKDDGGEVTVAGIVGCPQSETLIENCENTSTGLVHGSGATTSGYDIGGIGGGPSGASIIFKGCKNYGEVKQSGTLGGSMYIGGIVGYGYAFKSVENCENHGPITIGNNNTKAIYAGGIVGYARIAEGSGTTVHTKILKNCANYYDLNFAGKAGSYYAGGISGLIRNQDPEMYWEEISGLKNIANITFSGTASTPYYGGIFGSVLLATNCPIGALATIDNCVCYGDIKAVGLDGKIGLIMGVARSKFIATNCKVGGNLIFAEGTTTAINSTNWFNYIYKGAITEAVATADGCSLLTAKPAL